MVFPDIRPAAPHHYLIVPRHHYIDVKNLSADHIPMGKGSTVIEKIYEVYPYVALSFLFFIIFFLERTI